MTTQTILKNDGVFVYEDYKKGRGALRVSELNAQEYYQLIRRTNGGDVQAVLVEQEWHDARMAAILATPAPVFSGESETVADDFIGDNLSNMIDMINGNPQVTSRVNKTNYQGTTLDTFKIYSIIKLKEYYADGSEAVPFEESVKVGGSIYAYLIHYGLYQHLAATPTATTYTGTGNGIMVVVLKPGGAVAETVTVTATSATSFTVVGSVTGSMGVATVGTEFESPQVKLTITAGGTPFVATDAFIITSVAAAL